MVLQLVLPKKSRIIGDDCPSLYTRDHSLIEQMWGFDGISNTNIDA